MQSFADYAQTIEKRLRRYRFRKTSREANCNIYTLAEILRTSFRTYMLQMIRYLIVTFVKEENLSDNNVSEVANNTVM